MKDDVIKWLRRIGDDFAEEDSNQDISPECEGRGGPDEDGESGYCPDHNNCGICRFEYMTEKGWLSTEAQQN